MTERVKQILPRQRASVRHSVALLILLAIMALLPPGRLPYRPGATFSDSTLAHWPNAFFLRQSLWQHGQWPLWRPTSMLGLPFAAHPLAKVWYPPQWLVLIPVLPITMMLDVLVYVHIVFAALGAMAWAKAEGLFEWAGAFFAIAFALTPKIMAHLGAGHLDLVYAWAWAGWLMWRIRCCADDSTLFNGAMTGVVAAFMALADLRLAAYVLGVGIIYGARLRWQLRPALFAVLVLVALLAVYIVPLTAFSSHLTRSAITPEEAAVFSLPPVYLAGLFIPDTGGFHEWMTYLALPTLVLAGLALRTKNPTVYVFWGVAVLAALYALGDHLPLYRALSSSVPLLTWLRVPSRAWFVVALCLTLLSGFGAQSLLDDGLGRSGRLAAVALGGIGLPTVISSFFIGQPSLTGFGLALLGTGLGLLLAIRQPVVALGALGIVVLISLFALATTLIEGRRESDVFSAQVSSLSPPGRIYSPSFAVLPHEAEREGLLTLHGVDPFQLKWSAAAINRAAGVTGEGYSITAPHLPPDGDPAAALQNASPNATVLAALGVEQVVSTFPIDVDGVHELAQKGDLRIYEVEEAQSLVYFAQTDGPLDELKSIGGHADVKRFTPNKLVVEVDAPGKAILVVTQAWAPGWRVRVDGHPAKVMLIGDAIQGIQVTEGAHLVELAYRPVPDFIGLAISATTGLALVGWALKRWQAAR